MAALSYDAVPVLKDFALRRGIPFPLLSDPDSSIIRRFGLVNPEYPEGNPAHGVPYPGTLVVDAQGRVRAKSFEASYRERRTGASLLALEGETPAGAREIETPHFVLRTSSSNLEAVPGQRLTLVLDFQVRPKRHLYAPGAAGYRPLALRLAEQPLVVVHEPRFPESRLLVFAPTKEKVPVFQGRFRVLQDVTLSSGKEMADRLQSADPEVTLEGRLDYQVCTDRVCHPPASMPVSWSVKLRALDRERVPEGLRRRLIVPRTSGAAPAARRSR